MTTVFIIFFFGAQYFLSAKEEMVRMHFGKLVLGCFCYSN